MAIGLSRPVPSRPSAGFSSGADQSRPAKCKLKQNKTANQEKYQTSASSFSSLAMESKDGNVSSAGSISSSFFNFTSRVLMSSFPKQHSTIESLKRGSKTAAIAKTPLTSSQYLSNFSFIEKLRLQRSSSGGGSVKKTRSGGGSVKQRTSGGGLVKNRSYTGGSVKKRRSGGGSVIIYGMQCSNAIRSPEALTTPRRSDIERPSPELQFVTPLSTKLHASIAFHSLYLVLFSGEEHEEVSRCGPNGLSRG
ncbi:BnaA06g12290D [Brassica napus]|uniref:BnaA06g12290D protein n=1 Tax=Brassica napus TaxID=3708 RepID=A0A078GNI6_BRANA|nr:BnaA06g12290D [Brassica napus]